MYTIPNSCRARTVAMANIFNFEPWWRFGAAILIGALIGLEREFVQQRTDHQEFGGIRTFALLGLLGAGSAYFSERFGIVLFICGYLGTILLVWAGAMGAAIRGIEEGVTTEVAAIIVPLLGAMVVWGESDLAAALGVITALILALKPHLHRLARQMAVEDLQATLQFALITAVILPLLPNEGLGPYLVINPYQLWLLVVLVSGIGFLGYILMKLFGARRGIGLTGLLGGLVSSTATTLSFAGRSKQEEGLSTILAQGILLASCVMFPRILVEVAVVNSALLSTLLLPVGAMFVAGLATVAFLWRRERGREMVESESVTLSNPLKLSTAVGFGFVFAVVLIAVRAANEFFGTTGVYIASALTGLTDVDSITLSVSELSVSGELSAQVAVISILIAMLVNTLVKAIAAWVLGSRALRRTIAASFGVVLGVGILSIAVLFLTS